MNSPAVGRYLTLSSRCVASMRLLKGKRDGVKISVSALSVWGPSFSAFTFDLFDIYIKFFINIKTLYSSTIPE
jgi:hypothetical protein